MASVLAMEPSFGFAQDRLMPGRPVFVVHYEFGGFSFTDPGAVRRIIIM